MGDELCLRGHFSYDSPCAMSCCYSLSPIYLTYSSVELFPIQLEIDIHFIS